MRGIKGRTGVTDIEVEPVREMTDSNDEGWGGLSRGSDSGDWQGTEP